MAVKAEILPLSKEVYFSCDRKVSKYSRRVRKILSQLEGEDKTQRSSWEEGHNIIGFRFSVFHENYSNIYSFQIIETNEIFHVELLLTEHTLVSLTLFPCLQIFSQYWVLIR